MKVNNQMMDTQSIYNRGKEESTGVKDAAKKKDGTGSIKASELNLIQGDEIQQRKQQAQKQAMELLMSQFDSDGAIDQSLAERKQRILDSKEEAGEALNEVNKLSDMQKQLQETYGVADDSQEQKDLELRMKFNKSMKPNSDVTMTEEEMEQFHKLGPVTEYQEQAMHLEALKGDWQKQINDANKNIAAESQAIRATKQELLKYHGMDDAKRAAEGILQAASKEVAGMIIKESMDHVDEELEEKVEKAEEIKEEKEETEALREEKQAERES